MADFFTIALLIAPQVHAAADPVEVGLQAVVSPTGQPTIQQLTNLYRPRLHN